jgi:hypothetical protein
MSMDNVETVLSLLDESESTGWVAEQVRSTFSQGLSMSVKEPSQELAFRQAAPAGLTPLERRKREKYETTRAFTDPEKLDLLHESLQALYLDLPAIQNAALECLQKIGEPVENIEFVSPDEPEQTRERYTVNLDTITSERQYLAEHFPEFAKVLRS